MSSIEGVVEDREKVGLRDFLRLNHDKLTKNGWGHLDLTLISALSDSSVFSKKILIWQ